jgi:hypothetical protein
MGGYSIFSTNIMGLTKKGILHVIARANPEAIHWQSMLWIASPTARNDETRPFGQPQ